MTIIPKPEWRFILLQVPLTVTIPNWQLDRYHYSHPRPIQTSNDSIAYSLDNLPDRSLETCPARNSVDTWEAAVSSGSCPRFFGGVWKQKKWYNTLRKFHVQGVVSGTKIQVFFSRNWVAIFLWEGFGSDENVPWNFPSVSAEDVLLDVHVEGKFHSSNEEAKYW